MFAKLAPRWISNKSWTFSSWYKKNPGVKLIIKNRVESVSIFPFISYEKQRFEMRKNVNKYCERRKRPALITVNFHVYLHIEKCETQKAIKTSSAFFSAVSDYQSLFYEFSSFSSHRWKSIFEIDRFSILSIPLIMMENFQTINIFSDHENAQECTFHCTFDSLHRRPSRRPEILRKRHSNVETIVRWTSVRLQNKYNS